MATTSLDSKRLSGLQNIATQLRIDSINATTAAGSGHPTSCLSAAEIMAALFFHVMRFDPRNPQDADNDRFVLSKGHAAPVLYSAWAELDLFPREHLKTLRRFDSDLEGHPTPLLPFVAVPTGSLGQGLAVGLGMALAARMDGRLYRSYVLMGDGENAEGSVWETAELASFHQVDTLCGIVDVNRLGQSQPTMLQHELEIYKRRWTAFGWLALVVDGHDLNQLLAAFEQAAETHGRPTVILARTFKGHGVSFLNDQENWHGKALKPQEAEKALGELQAQMQPGGERPTPLPPARANVTTRPPEPMPAPNFNRAQPVATREAFGEALAAAGAGDTRLSVLDGDVKNSTFTEDFQAKAPGRFVEGFIAEQNMVGMAMGLAAAGRIPFVSTFACFLTRAADFIRLAGLARSNVKFVGTHAGVSIGEDGGSQMGLEDLAMFRALPESTVLYPSDATSAWRAVELAIHQPGVVYIRTGRPKQPILYDTKEAFAIGKGKLLRSGNQDVATVVAAGVTLNEALKAADELKSQGVAIRVIDLFSVRPVDTALLLEAARATQNLLITVEDHHAAGGLGDAVAEAVGPEGVRVVRLAVREMPRSGKPEELMAQQKIDAAAIRDTVLQWVPARVGR